MLCVRFKPIHMLSHKSEHKSKSKTENKSRMDHHCNRNESETSPIPIEIKKPYVSTVECLCVNECATFFPALSSYLFLRISFVLRLILSPFVRTNQHIDIISFVFLLLRKTQAHPSKHFVGFKSTISFDIYFFDATV